MREPLPPRFTEPVKRENFGALYTMYHSDLPNGGGVTAQSMEELFGKEIARNKRIKLPGAHTKPGYDYYGRNNLLWKKKIIFAVEATFMKKL